MTNQRIPTLAVSTPRKPEVVIHSNDAQIQSQTADIFYEAGDYFEAMKSYQRAIEIDPNSGNYEKWVESLEKLDKNTKHKAIENLEKRLASKPEYVHAYFSWGLALHSRKNYAEAIEKYQKAAELKSDYVRAYDGWGLALYDQTKYLEAIEQYRKATEVQPDDAFAYNGWGDALYAEQKCAEAIEKYQKAIGIDPNSGNYERWVECLDKVDKNTKCKAIEAVQEIIKGKPDYVDAYNEWGNALSKRTNFPEAIEKYRQAIELKSDYAPAYKGWADALYEEKKYAEAIKQYRKATELQPENPDAYNNWGLALYDQKLYTEATEQYRKATEADPNYALAYNNWGDALYDQQRYHEAIEKYQKAIKLDPKSVDYDSWFECLEKLDEKAKRTAITDVEKIIAGKPEYVDVYNDWGVALYNRKRYGEAIEKYRRAAELKSNYAFAYYNWGLALYAQKLYAEAIEQYRKATEVDSHYAVAYNNWGNALYDQQRYHEAIEKYQKAIKIDPKSVDYGRWLECLEKLDEKAKRTAITDVERIIAGKPEYVDAYNDWGVALYSRKRYAEAIEKYRAAIALKSDYARPYHNLGLALHGQGHYAEAIEQYQKVVDVRPNFVTDSYSAWGLALAALKRYEEAIVQYRKSIEAKPDNAGAYTNWGNASYELHNYAEAAEKYQRAIEIEPSAGEYEHWVQSVDQLDESKKAAAEISVERAIERKKSAVAYLNWGLALYNRGRYPEAISKYRKALEYNPNYALAHNNLGVALFAQKDYSGAVATYRQALDADRTFALAHRNLANTLFELEDYAAAAEQYQRAIELEPNAVRYDKWLAVLDKLDEPKKRNAIAKAKTVLHGKPEYGDAYLSWGNALYGQGKYAEAIELYGELAELKPGDASAYNNWGLALFEEKQYAQAIELYRKAVAATPDYVRAYTNWGNASYELHNYAEAAEKYQRAVEIEPGAGEYEHWVQSVDQLDESKKAAAEISVERAIERKKSAVAYLNWGLALYNRGRYPEAISKYRKALEYNPNYALAHNNLGVALFAQKDYSGAVATYRQALDADRTSALAHRNLADALFELKDYAAAAEQYQRVIELEPNAVRYDKWLAALDYLEDSKRRDAVVNAERLLPKKPEHADAYIAWGNTLYGLERYADAADKYEQAVNLQPNSGIAYSNWGLAFHAQKRFTEANEKYRKATELFAGPAGKNDDAAADAYHNWGLALYDQKLYEQAIERYRKAIELRPKFANAYNSWGSALHNQKLYDQAVEKYREAINADPKLAIAYTNWGLVFADQQQYERAIPFYQKAIDADSQFASAYECSADALFQQKSYDEAIKRYEKAIELNRNSGNYAKWLTCLDNLQSDKKHTSIANIRQLIEGEAIYFKAQMKLGDAFIRQNDYDLAVQQYERAAKLTLKDASDYANIYFNWARALQGVYRYDEAVQRLQDAIDKDPHFASAYHNIAFNYWRQARYHAGWKAWDEACKAYERVDEKQRTADYFLNYGRILHEMFGQLDKADDIYTRGLKEEPAHAGLLASLVTLCLEKADTASEHRNSRCSPDELEPDKRAKAQAHAWSYFKRAEALLKQDTDKDQADASAVLHLGELYLSMREHEKAEKYLKRAVEADSTSSRGHADLGVLFMRNEAYKDAIDCFKQARNRDPYSLTIRSNLAAGYSQMQLLDRAEAEYKRILDITENHIPSHIGLAEIYKQLADTGETDMYHVSIEHFARAVQLSNSRARSQRVTKKDLAAIYYSVGYSKVKLYEAAKLAKDETLLVEAKNFFELCRDADPEHYKARRAIDKIDKRIGNVTYQRFVDKTGPPVVVTLSILVFFASLGLSIYQQKATFVMLALGSLVFMIAGLYLPQLLKLKVGGIQLEKSSAESVTTPVTIGVEKISAEPLLDLSALGQVPGESKPVRVSDLAGQKPPGEIQESQAAKKPEDKAQDTKSASKVAPAT